MTTIEKLQNTLDNLPDLTTKLQTWNKIIKELDFKERSEISLCIDSIGWDIEVLENNFENSKQQYEEYKFLFDKLLERLNLPVNAYQERIDEINLKEWKEKVDTFKKETDEKFKQKALDLAQNYFNEFPQKSASNPYLTNSKYMQQCESMVTPFLFQPPHLACDSSKPGVNKKREYFHLAFSDWKPNNYCSIFYKQLRKLFE